VVEILLMRVRSLLLAFTLLPLIDPHAALAVPPPQQLKLDQYGDPLPDSAIFRIGTARLRPGALIKAMAFTADGKRLVTANTQTGVQIWDVATGKELKSLMLPEDTTVVAVAPSGAYVALFNKARECSMWEVAEGKKLYDFGLAWEDVGHLLFSPDSKALAATTWRGAIRLFDVASGKLRHTCARDSLLAKKVCTAFAADGKLLATVADGRLTVIDVATVEAIHGFDDKPGSYESAGFTPDGKFLAALTGNGVTVWDLAAGNESGPVSNDHVQCYAFSRNNQTLITGVSDGSIAFRELASGQLKRRVAAHYGGIGALVVSHDGSMFASSGDDCVIRVWEVSTGRAVHDFPDHQTNGVDARFLLDGKSLISVTNRWMYHDPCFRFWDAAEGKFLREATWSKDVNAVLSGDGRILAAGCPGGFEIRDLNSGARQTVQAPGLTKLLALSDDGTRLLAHRWIREPADNASLDSQLTIFGVRSRATVAQLKIRGAQVSGRFSDDGRTVLLASDVFMECWDWQRNRLRYPSLPVAWPGQWSHSGYWFLLRNGSEICEPVTGQPLAKLPVDGNAYSCAAFSRSNRFLALGTIRGEILVWDTVQSTVATRFTGHRGAVTSVDFSPDAKRLVTSGDDATILLWDVHVRLAKAEYFDLRLAAKEVESLWRELARPETERAYAAMVRLSRAPHAALSVFQERFLPASASEAAQIRAWIAELESDKYKVREQATTALAQLGDFAQLALEKVLDTRPKLETRRRVELLLDKIDKQPPSPQRLQQERALLVLQWIGTPEAKRLLEALAQGAPETWLTEQAKAACWRMD
jgi:WD40 repeat protein